MDGVPPPAPQVAAARTALLAGLILFILMASDTVTRTTAPIDPSRFFISKEHFPGQSCWSPHVSDLPHSPSVSSAGRWDLGFDHTLTRLFPACHSLLISQDKYKWTSRQAFNTDLVIYLSAITNYKSFYRYIYTTRFKASLSSMVIDMFYMQSTAQIHYY